MTRVLAPHLPVILLIVWWLLSIWWKKSDELPLHQPAKLYVSKTKEMTSQTAYHTCIGLVMSWLFFFFFCRRTLAKSTLKNSSHPPGLRWENMTELPGLSGHTEELTLSPLKYTVLCSQHSCCWKVSLRKVGPILLPQWWEETVFKKIN